MGLYQEIGLVFNSLKTQLTTLQRWRAKKEKIYKFLAMSLRNAQFMDREGFRTLQNENPEIKSEIDRLFRQTGNLSATGNNNTDGIVLSITPPKEPPPKKPVYPGLRDVNL